MIRIDHRRSEGGYTLTEVLVAIVILAVAVVGVVGAMGSALFSSTVHRQDVTADTVLRRYAEQLEAATTTYVPCAAPTGANQYPALTNPPANFTATVLAVDFWNGSNTAGFGAAPANCSAANDPGVQRITLQANAGPTNMQQLQIVKRKP